MKIFAGFYISVLFLVIGIYSLLLGRGIITLPNKEKGQTNRRFYYVVGIMLIVLSIIRSLFILFI